LKPAKFILIIILFLNHEGLEILDIRRIWVTAVRLWQELFWWGIKLILLFIISVNPIEIRSCKPEIYQIIKGYVFFNHSNGIYTVSWFQCIMYSFSGSTMSIMINSGWQELVF
jgi:hypothetical protein